MNRFTEPKSGRMAFKIEGLDAINFYNPEDPEGAYELNELRSKEHLKAIAEKFVEMESRIIDYVAYNKLTSEEKGEIVAKLLSSGVNSGDARSFSITLNDSIRGSHRYLQKEIFNGVVKLIADVDNDYDENRYDGRNVVYVRLFKAMFEAFLERTGENGRYISLKDTNSLPPDKVGY